MKSFNIMMPMASGLDSSMVSGLGLGLIFGFALGFVLRLALGWALRLVLILALILGLTFIFFFDGSSFSQAFSGTANAENNVKKYQTKYLSLYIGVPHDVKVPLMTNAIKATGTFRPFTKAKINKSNKTLRFEPKKEGVATLILQNPNTETILYEFRIDVKKTNLSKVAREVRSLLGDISGIEIKIINNKVIVDGEILIPRDMIRIHSVVKQYGDLSNSFVVLSLVAEKKIAQFIERDIDNPEVQVRVINKKFILEGFVNDAKEKDRAYIIAQSYINDIIVDEAVADKKVLTANSKLVINLLKIKPAPKKPPKKMVQLVFHYVELSKNYTKGFRFQWTPDLGDGSQINFTSGGRGLRAC